MSGPACPGCGGRAWAPAFAYDAPPVGETPFDLRGRPYRRRYDRCAACGHLLAVHDLDLSALYTGDYVAATYGTAERMRAVFDRIVGLPPERSDNRARVARVCAHADATRPGGGRRLLDVGAGLGVFPHGMRAAGWTCLALDPDPGACAHIRAAAGVETVTGDFMASDPAALGVFDAVTLNKVLEHVEDPVGMLARTAPLLAPGGFVYVEVPDVAAASEGPGREEFFVEHLHVFSPASLALSVERAGLRLVRIERLREPSTKFTLFAFAERPVPS